MRLSSLMVIIAMILLSACTRKNNLTGDNWSDVRPLSFIDSTFTDGYSYPAEQMIKGTETTLLCSNYNSKSSIAIMRFNGLPDITTMTSVDSVSLKIVVMRRSPVRRTPILLEFYRLNQNWAADSTALVLDANMLPLNLGQVSIDDSVATTGDTLTIDIPSSVIAAWSTEDVTGFNLVIKTTSDGYAEFRSIDSGYGPVLSFKYQIEGDTSNRSFSITASSDSYRVTAPDYVIENDRWQIQNINPSRTFVKFALNTTKFTDMEGVPLDETQLQRVTINKAQLVLYIKNNPYYDKVSYSLLALNVVKDSISTPIALEDGDTELMSYTGTTTGYASGDSIVITITPMIQGYTSGNITNKGIVIRSLHEMLNLGELEFWHFNDPALPQDKKPVIRVTYTPPFL